MKLRQRPFEPGLLLVTTSALLGCPSHGPELVIAYDSELDVFIKIEGPTSAKVGEEVEFKTEASAPPGRFASDVIHIAYGAGGKEIRPYYNVGQILAGGWKQVVTSSFLLRPSSAGTYRLTYQLQSVSGVQPATLELQVR